ncbi:O-acetylhomoserine aminocarboxypropyltransferase/cysteine synthase [Rhizobium sp. KAs_5_22]|uniref:O-acetylhomoserine aminocarboxypropyltransferase/cysteine synthase family protein n=1 Tax=Ciceribacter selenitireducens TaxID=448181 RepID=UPI0004B24135|nr:O-acetylhomoserine aminocarboxypropyltransferase/cysteine synthase family protein [Ciceribacter selenitireducens]PPJ48223.1 O-acetylhomoserine aminocarboxypropyltransferase/cysteine synthase [Rhizobium sp. KAs_5_22]
MTIQQSTDTIVQSATPQVPVGAPSFKSLHPETLALHGGNFRFDPTTGAVAVPIYQTTSYQLPGTEGADKLFALEAPGHLYSRVSNPTQDAFEQRLAEIEGGAAALAVASGQAASAFAILNVARAGDNIVSAAGLYGGTWALFAATLKSFGIETRFVDAADPEAFARATDDRTRAYYAESLPNPKLEVFPIGEVAAIGRRFGIPLIVDNTAAPLIIRPLEHGAAVVVYSATKYIGGHGTSIGGAIVDGGNFPWAELKDRQPNLNEPDASYEGKTWIEKADAIGFFPYILRARAVLLRDIGAAISPQNVFQLIQGLETLPLRLRQHNENAIKVAEFLKNHPKVANVIFPKFQTGLAGERAAKYLKSGSYGALIGFELKGGREAGRRFIDALKLFYHLANIGDARSLAIHPSTTTHSQLSADDQLATGVTPGYVRLSIGIEHADDIISDLSQAIDAA